jgi:hypothetical protein
LGEPLGVVDIDQALRSRSRNLQNAYSMTAFNTAPGNTTRVIRPPYRMGEPIKRSYRLRIPKEWDQNK